MKNRFTERAQHALTAALACASAMGHTYIGSEHLLLGLLSDGDSIAGRMLAATLHLVSALGEYRHTHDA